MSEDLNVVKDFMYDEVIGALQDCIICADRNGGDYLGAIEKSISFYRKLKGGNK